MLITSISINEKGFYHLFCGDELLCSLHPEIFLQSDLHVGDELDLEQLNRLLEESEYKIGKERALKLLERKSYTSYQLYEKLNRELSGEASRRVVNRMTELGLINDLDYASRYTHDLIVLRHFAPRRVRLELRRCGLSPEIIDETMLEWENYNLCDSAQEILHRRYSNFATDEKIRKRAQNALLRMGYSYEDIRAAMTDEEEG